MSGESGSGSGETTVRVVTGLTVQKQRLRVSAPGRVGAPACAESPTDCCEPAASVCCPEGLSASTPFAFAAPIGFGGADVVITGDLIESNNRYSGVFESEGAQLKLALDCIDNVWIANGIITYATGETKRFTLPLTPEGTDLSADVEIPGREDGALIVEHPCATSGASGGSGSGESGSGESGSGAAGIECPGVCNPTVATVHDVTGDCGCLPGTLTYAGVGSGEGAVSSWTSNTCPGNPTYELRCVGGIYRLYVFGSTECTFISGTDVPLSLTFQTPDLGGNCGGAGGTARITLTCS